MKRLSFFMGMLLFVSMGMFASPRSVSEAEALAADFLQQHPALSSPSGASRVVSADALTLAHTHLQSDATTPAVYVFSRADEGFVLVSADDRSRSILGYADEGVFRTEDIPANVRFWLDMYAHEIERAGKSVASGTVTSSSEAATIYTAVSPLCSATWNQDAPYNNLCPTKDDERCVTGCVATAAAQVMYANKWPTKGTGSHSYTWNGQTLSADFGNTTYQWSNMLDDYSDSSTTAQQTAVATLMYHCGVACEMEYGISSEGGSGANTAMMAQALNTYFGYDAGIKVLPKDYMDADEMLDMMAADLQAGHTILMSGRTVNDEGHAFVCDGIQSNGYLHINWGWGGYCDGYFALSALEPADQGIGGASSGYAFTEYVSAFTNIKPDEGGKGVVTVTADDITWTSDAQLAKTSPIYFQIDHFSNAGACNVDGYYGFAIYQDGNVVSAPVSNYMGGTLLPGYHFTYSQSTSVLVDDLPDGQYELSVGISQDATYWPFYVAGVGEKRFPFVIQNGYIYQGTEVPTDTAGLTIRVRIGEDCTMDVSNGVWLWWWDGTNSACAATTYADGWYTATLQPETTPIGCLVVNRDVTVDGWGDASTQSLDYQGITEDICLQVGAIADGKMYASLTSVDCESGTEEEITPSFDFTRLEVEDWNSAGFANNLDIHIVTEDFSNTVNGFFGTDLYLYAIAKSMTSVVGTYALNHSSNFGRIVSGVVHYGKGTMKEISLSSGCVTISLDANGDYLISYELYDEEGTPYIEEGRTISVAKTNSYTYNAATDNWELYALQNECVTAALSASGIKSLTENLMHTDVTTMSYFAEGVVDYMVNDSAQMVQYGTGRFYISDDGTRNNEYYLYNTKWLGNSKFTAENAGLLHLGDTVVAFGPVQNYKGTTPEMQKGYVYEYRPYVEPQYSAPEDLTATTVNGYDYTFSWSGGEKPAPVYMLEVLCDEGIYHSSTLSETSQAVTLAIEGAYTWRVSACDSVENIVATTEALDSIMATNVPDYDAKNLQIVVSDSTMTATWESPANIFGIYIFDAQGNEVVWDLIDQKSYTWAGSAGTYYFYVRPVNDEMTMFIGTEWTYQEFTFYAEDPALYAPYDLQVNATFGKMAFRWQADKGSHWIVQLTWEEEGTQYQQAFNTYETALTLNVSGLANVAFQWAVATTDENGNFLSEYVSGPEFVMPENPYQLLNLQADSEDGYNYTFTWEYASEQAPRYLIIIKDEAGEEVVRAAVGTVVYTHRFTQSGMYQWTLYALDEEGNGLGFSNGPAFEVTMPDFYSYTITTTVPEDCTMDFSNGMWYYWWNDDSGLTGSVQALPNNEGKYVATIEAPCEYIGCLIATADPLTTSWSRLQQTLDSPTLYGDTCLTIGLHYWEKYWYLDARPCDEDLSDYLPANLQVSTGVGTADFTWTATEYEQFEILLNQVENPDVVDSYTMSYPDLSLIFNADAVGQWQWRVRALSYNNAPLTAFVEGPEFEIKENPYLPYNLKATTQDSATYYLTWETDVQAPQYLVQAGNGFNAFVTTQPVEVTFEQEGYYSWRVVPCDSVGNWLGFVYGEDIYVPAHAVPDYSISDLQVQTVGTTTTATWNSTWDNFAVWLYDRSTWNRISVSTTANTFAQWENLDAGNYQVNVIPLDKSDAYVWDSEAIVQFTVEETPAPTPQYNITITAGTGGSVNSDINGTYDAGTTLDLVATPDGGYRFQQWSDGNLQAERTIVLMQDTILGATFELIPTVVEHTLTVNTAVGGTTNLTGTMTYEDGAQVSLVAYADEGYTFTKWEFEDKTESTDNPLFLTMTEDMTVTPVFTENAPVPTYTLTVNKEGQGTVTVDPQADTYQRGTIVTLTATPADGWRFVQWSDGDKGTTHRIVITQDTVVTATFEEIPEPVYYTLTVNKEGQGTVTVTPQQDQYEAGTTVTLTAVPEEGWHFKQWEDGTTNATRTIKMTEDMTVTATFEEDTPEPTYYTLTVNKEGQGTVTVTPQQDQYEAGTTVTLTAVPEEGWHFKQWEDGTTNATRTIKMTEDMTVTATFEEDTPEPTYYTLTVNKEGQGTVTVTPQQDQYEAGTTVTLTAVPEEGWHFKQWEDGTTNATRTIKMTEDMTVTATFEEDTPEPTYYTLTVSKEGQGTVTVTPQQDKYEAGTTVTLTAEPKEGWLFKQWEDGTTNATRVITMTENKVVTATFAEIPVYAVTDLSVSVTTSSATATWKSEAPLFEVVITDSKNVVQTSDTIAEKTYLFKGKAGKKYTIAVRPMDSDRKTYLDEAASKEFTLERLYSVFISAGVGGSVNDEVNGDEYVYGTQLTIIATPKEGYLFKSWSDGDTAATREITVTDDITLEATFRRIPSYTVTIYAANGGTTDPAPDSYTLLENESMTITATPDEGFVFTQWIVNGEVETTNPFVITAIATDYNIEPVFAKEEMGTEQTTVQPAAEKFIHNGLLYIRRGEKVFDAQGHTITLE
ncbi:MAG: C10 family peptidase [Paludibacteraceae bacterium]